MQWDLGPYAVVPWSLCSGTLVPFVLNNEPLLWLKNRNNCLAKHCCWNNKLLLN